MMIKNIEQVFFDMMEASNRAINDAGKQGAKYVGTNQYKEAITLADVKIRESVVNVLKRSGLPIGLISEEVKGIECFNCNEPEYIVSLDEQDGFGIAVEKNDFKLRYGTMAAIFQGENPKWDDAIIGGTIEHNPKKRLVYGSKQEGKAFIIDDKGKKQIRTSGKKSLEGGLEFLTDKWFNVINTLFDIPFNNQEKGFTTSDVFGSERGYVDVALGKIDALGECTRKDNQEPVTSYLMIKNAGGAMYSLKLKSYLGASDFAGAELVEIGNWPYRESAEKAKMGRAPLLSVATPELAQTMVDYMNKFNDWKGSLMKDIIEIKG